jgi:hypothetical protein
MKGQVVAGEETLINVSHLRNFKFFFSNQVSIKVSTNDSEQPSLWEIVVLFIFYNKQHFYLKKRFAICIYSNTISKYVN